MTRGRVRRVRRVRPRRCPRSGWSRGASCGYPPRRASGWVRSWTPSWSGCRRPGAPLTHPPTRLPHPPVRRRATREENVQKTRMPPAAGGTPGAISGLCSSTATTTRSGAPSTSCRQALFALCSLLSCFFPAALVLSLTGRFWVRPCPPAGRGRGRRARRADRVRGHGGGGRGADTPGPSPPPQAALPSSAVVAHPVVFPPPPPPPKILEIGLLAPEPVPLGPDEKLRAGQARRRIKISQNLLLPRRPTTPGSGE